MTIWRDVDHHYRRFGFSIWLTGGEINLGKRGYRVRWSDRRLPPHDGIRRGNPRCCLPPR